MSADEVGGAPIAGKMLLRHMVQSSYAFEALQAKTRFHRCKLEIKTY